MTSRSTIARFPIGLTFSKKRFPKAKELTLYTIVDIFKTFNHAGECVKIEYSISHQFLGSTVVELVVDTIIARSLSPEQLTQYL